MNEKNYIIENSIKFSGNSVNDARQTTIYRTFDFDRSQMDESIVQFFEAHKNASSFGISNDSQANRTKYYIEYNNQIRAISKYNNIYKYNIYNKHKHSLYVVYNCDEYFNKYGLPIARHLAIGGDVQLVQELLIRASNKRNIQISNWIAANKERFVTWLGLTSKTITIYYI